MTCVIEFSNQYCPICHTTDHSLNKCAVKGCSLCLHKKHPFYKCPEKCKCARRPVHLADRCPAKQAPKPIFQMPMLLPPKPHWALPGKHTTCDYNVLNIEPTSEEEASSRTSKPLSPIQKSPISLTKGATMVNSSKSIFGQKEGTATSLASGSQASWARAFNLGTQSNSSNQASHLIGSIPLGSATPKAKAPNAPQQSKSQVSTSVSPVTKGQGLAQPSISSIGSSVTKLGRQVLQPSPLKSPKAASKASSSNGKDFSTFVAGLESSEFSMSSIGSFTTESGFHIPGKSTKNKTESAEPVGSKLASLSSATTSLLNPSQVNLSISNHTPVASGSILNNPVELPQTPRALVSTAEGILASKMTPSHAVSTKVARPKTPVRTGRLMQGQGARDCSPERSQLPSKRHHSSDSSPASPFKSHLASPKRPRTLPLSISESPSRGPETPEGDPELSQGEPKSSSKAASSPMKDSSQLSHPKLVRKNLAVTKLNVTDKPPLWAEELATLKSATTSSMSATQPDMAETPTQKDDSTNDL